MRKVSQQTVTVNGAEYEKISYVPQYGGYYSDTYQFTYFLREIQGMYFVACVRSNVSNDKSIDDAAFLMEQFFTTDGVAV